MTNHEIIALAERLGLHWDFDDDDPEMHGDETIFLWHEADAAPDGGLLIRFCNGQPFVADLKTWGTADDQGLSAASLEGNGTQVLHMIGDYAVRYELPARPMQIETADVPQETAKPASSRIQADDWRPRSQRREAVFRAVDPLGRYYKVEVYREVVAGRTEESQQLVTVDGETVERIAKGRYRLTQACVELSSDDPCAP